MTNDLVCKCAPATSRPRDPRRLPVGSWFGLLAGIAAIVAPKCPLCLAAYLSVLGIGAGLAQVAPLLLPLGVVVGSIALASLCNRMFQQEMKR